MTHSRPDLAVRCYLRLVDFIAPSRIIVVSNPPAAGAMRPGIPLGSLLVNDRVYGYGENLNRGRALLPADVELVLVCNDDVIPVGNAIPLLAERMRSDPRMGLIAPRFVGPTGAQVSAFTFPSPASEMARLLILPARAHVALRRAVDPVPDSGPVDWVLGAAMLVRARAFDSIGGFDAGFFLYSEETDMAMRLHRAGWTVVYSVDATFHHEAAASTGPVRYRRAMARSRYRYICKHWRWRARLTLCAMLPPVVVWDVGYTLARILLDLRRAREKVRLLNDTLAGIPRP